MSQLRVRDLMTTQVITVKPTDTVRQAVIRMAVDNVSGAPVVDNRNHVLGMISQTDILKLILKYQDKLDEDDAGHLLNTPLDTSASSQDVNIANKEISDKKVEDIMVKSTLVTTPDSLRNVSSTAVRQKLSRIRALRREVAGLVPGEIMEML